jgi:hypothetical protein
MMSYKRIFEIVGVLFIATCGWIYLGKVVQMRSGATNSVLKKKVEQTWGGAIVQVPPDFYVSVPGARKKRLIHPVKNTVTADLLLKHRAKGLIWYPSYECDFKAVYDLVNKDKVAAKIRMHFSFPSAEATYDNFVISVNDKPIEASIEPGLGVDELIELTSGETCSVAVSYKTRGMGIWKYVPNASGKEIKNLNVQIKTNFQDVDFPDSSLSPNERQISGSDCICSWRADNLITSRCIGMIMPEKLNPGPLVERITFFAPFCLIFFFVLIMTIGIIYKIDIHPMHYLFIAGGFFAFHLLFAYMVDLVNVHISFIVSACITVFLVSRYLRAALGSKFPWKVAFLGQLLYLILFSYSFFIDGMTGLTVTVGSILTLGALMKVTAKTNWNEVFNKRKKKPEMPEGELCN